MIVLIIHTLSMMICVVTLAQEDDSYPAVVGMDQVITEPFQPTFPVLGRLTTQRQGSVATRISGTVVKIFVDKGDRVKRGDRLASLDRTVSELQVALQRARLQEAEAVLQVQEASLALAAQTLSRLERLRGSSSFSRARYEDGQQEVTRIQASLAEAEAQRASKRVELSQAQLQLTHTLINAPYDGIIIDKHTEIGSYLLTGAPVVTMIDDQRIEIEVDVSTDHLTGLGQGTSIMIRLDDGSEHHATVRAQIPREDPRTRTRTIHFTPQWNQSPSKSLAINQAVTLFIPLSSPRSVISVHKDAVINQPQGSVVFLVVDGVVQISPITLGDAFGGRFEVLSGLEEGDTVVIRGNERLQPGQKVYSAEEEQ